MDILTLLEHYEEIGYHAGNDCYEVFNETKNLSALRGTIAACRLSMQAIRDQTRYKISK